MREALRIVGIVVSLLFMIGFGMCDAYGLIGAMAGDFWVLFLICGLMGLGIASAAWLVLRWLIKQGKPPGDHS